MLASHRCSWLVAPVLAALAATALMLLVGTARGADPAPGSLSMGPQAMEGDLKVAPGTALLAGYDFTIPGKHPDVTVSFAGGTVTFQATCVSGPGGGTIVVGLPDASYTDPENSSAWYPSGDQHSSLVYQGTAIVPDLCDGGKVRLQQGGTFTATVLSSAPSYKVNVRWHYSANGTPGSWSGTKSVMPAAVPPDGGGGGEE